MAGRLPRARAGDPARGGHGTRGPHTTVTAVRRRADIRATRLTRVVLARATRPTGVPGGAVVPPGGAVARPGGAVVPPGGAGGSLARATRLTHSCSRGRPGPRGCQWVLAAGSGGAVARSRGRPAPDRDGDTRTWARSRPRSRGRPGLSDLDLDRPRSRGRPGPPRAGNARRGRRSPSPISLPRSPRPAAAPRPSLEKSRRRGLTLSRS